MIGVLHELRHRKLALQEDSAAQRDLIAQSASVLAARGVILDRAVAVARGAVTRPLVLGSLFALALAVGPRRILGWTARVATLFGLARQLTTALRAVSR